MSPTQFNNDHHQNHNNQHAKREQQQLIHGACPVPLKINKDSHFIKKTSPSSSSSSTSSLAMAAATPPPKPQQHRHPVIIYTHSPKVIHTHPRDFMALVQKLTGFSRSDGDENAHRTAKSAVTTGNEISEGGENNNNNNNNNNNKNKRGVKGSFGTEDNESSSAITTEDNCGDGQVNSCLLPPYFDPPPNPYLTNMPLFAPNSVEFLCSNPPLFNYTDSLFFNPPSMRNSTLEAMNEFRDY